MPGRAILTGFKAGSRRHGRSLTLLSTATILAALHVPLWAYERGLLGPADPNLRVLLAGPVRLVAVLRDAARFVTAGAALLLWLDVREQWLNLVGRLLASGDRDTDGAGSLAPGGDPAQ
jgi:hypothetical protein